MENNEINILYDWLSPDSEKARSRYFKLRRELIESLRFCPEPEELAEDALETVLTDWLRKEIDLSRYSDPRHLILKAAKHVAYRKCEKCSLFSRELDKKPQPIIHQTSESEEVFQLIERALEEIPKEDKALFLSYALSDGDVPAEKLYKQLADEMHLSPDDLRARISRIREALRKILSKLEQEPLLEENNLLHKINTVFPADERQRYNELYRKFQEENLTESEQSELTELSDKFEVLNAKRLEYIGQLARLRGQSLKNVIKDLGIKP